MIDHDLEAQFIKAHIPKLDVFFAKEIAAFVTTPLGMYPRPIIDFKVETKIMKDALYGLKISRWTHERQTRLRETWLSQAYQKAYVAIKKRAPNNGARLNESFWSTG